ncbi:MAG TPA: hypothetical protein VFH37_01310 [Candidatus Saccharimonadales bacterium]|nr:hypothetical protein [Candidatus Saccharimonadales bacterium]
MTDVYLAILIFLPAALTYLLKSNASAAFLALCGGFSLFTLSGSDIQHLVGKTRITSLTSNDVDLALLVLPLLLTLFLTYRGVTAKRRRYLELVPALCAGGFLAIVGGPMLNSALSTNFSHSQAWQDLQTAQTYIVAVGLTSSLLLFWAGTRGHHSKKHK